MSDAAQIIHDHSRSFSLAVRFLPARVRGDVMSLYAWCRTVDDIVDEATDFDDATHLEGAGESDNVRVRLDQFKADYWPWSMGGLRRTRRPSGSRR